jgi:hypothetical protein
VRTIQNTAEVLVTATFSKVALGSAGVGRKYRAEFGDCLLVLLLFERVALLDYC